jgi:hypothetical protein
MSNRIQISIPTPCHEKWADMSQTDKGRFCASCQKAVIDFTHSSDREIATALKNGNTCGRFYNHQLNRDLIIPKEKNTLWIAASAAVVSFFTLGSDVVKAQEPATEITPKADAQAKDIKNEKPGNIEGIVTDADGAAIPGVKITNLKSGIETNTGYDGEYLIAATVGDTLHYTYIGFNDIKTPVIDGQSHYNIAMSAIEDFLVTVGGAFTRPSFFSRIWYRVGNLFN